MRIYQGKRRALIYVVDDNILQIFKKAIELGGRTAVASEESAADDVTRQAPTTKQPDHTKDCF